MATLSKRGTTILLSVTTARGATLWALRSDCHILKRRNGSGHFDAGRVKPDLTIDQIATILARKYPDATIRRHGVAGDFVPNPLAKHTAARAAQAKRTEKAHAKDAAERAAEAALELPNELESLEPLAERVMAYVANTLRTGAACHDGRLRYIRDMARFHGGATGGYLGTAIMADFSLPSGYAHRPALDAIADAVARCVFGSDLHAARRWGQALFGR